MTLLMTVLAAILCSVIWYCSERARRMKVACLCYMFWGASIMWFMDAIAEYTELRDEMFHASAADIANDALLGISVIALALLIWIGILFVKDPCGILRKKRTV